MIKNIFYILEASPCLESSTKGSLTLTISMPHYKPSQQYLLECCVCLHKWLRYGSKTGGVDAWLQRPVSFSMESRGPTSLSGNMNMKLCIIEFIYFLAKVGNVSQPDQCGRVHLCPPNHLLMATINCRPTAPASNTVAIKFNKHILYCGLKVLHHGDSRLMYWLSPAW